MLSSCVTSRLAILNVVLYLYRPQSAMCYRFLVYFNQAGVRSVASKIYNIQRSRENRLDGCGRDEILTVTNIRILL